MLKPKIPNSVFRSFTSAYIDSKQGKICSYPATPINFSLFEVNESHLSIYKISLNQIQTINLCMKFQPKSQQKSTKKLTNLLKKENSIYIALGS